MHDNVRWLIRSSQKDIESAAFSHLATKIGEEPFFRVLYCRILYCPRLYYVASIPFIHEEFGWVLTVFLPRYEI